MAVDMFMKIEGVKGEAWDETHKDEIDVLAWSWGMSQSGTAHIGRGAGAGKVNVRDVSFTKYVDMSSTELMVSCCNGKHFKEALLTVRKAGENPVEYVKIKMEQVIITSISTGGSGGEDRLTENVTLNFARVGVEYTSQDENGEAKDKKNMTWNIAGNAK
jgi:type VI secretion system secreted protein Hcp